MLLALCFPCPQTTQPLKYLLVVACVYHQTRALDHLFVFGSQPRGRVKEPCNSISAPHTWAVLQACVSCAWWQRGAGVTVSDNGILFLENLMQASLSPFLTAGVSFRH